MDNELREIKRDLDSVLERLAEYMSSDKLKTELEPHPSSRDDAARAILHYVSSGNDSLVRSIETSRLKKRGPTEYPSTCRLGKETKGLSGELAGLLNAFKSISDWQYIRWPLEDKDMEVLSEAVTAWSVRECQFIGQHVGLELISKNEVDRRKRARDKAAFDALFLHLEDPNKHPVDTSLFEEVGSHYGMSASTVSRAYYSKDFRQLREAFERVMTKLLSDLGKN